MPSEFLGPRIATAKELKCLCNLDLEACIKSLAGLNHLVLWGKSVSLFLSLAAIYLLIGLVAGALFVGFGIGRVDTAAQGTSIGFRLLILPGSITLWPFIVAKWLTSPSGDLS
jgi:hypothetical protein